MNCKNNLMTLGKEGKWIMLLCHNCSKQCWRGRVPSTRLVKKSVQQEHFHGSTWNVSSLVYLVQKIVTVFLSFSKKLVQMLFERYKEYRQVNEVLFCFSFKWLSPLDNKSLLHLQSMDMSQKKKKAPEIKENLMFHSNKYSF